MSSFWIDRPTLVTGATGMLGGALVRRLVEAGADVVCLVRDRVPDAEFHRARLDRRVKTVVGDVRDQAVVERVLGEYEIRTVQHLAAQTLVPVANRNPVSTFESNIAGTWVVLEACRRSPLVGQIVLASSDKAYGSSDRLPYDEDTPLRGRHPYDVSKSCADLIAQAYAATYDSPVGITRCGNFFGPGDLNWNRIVPGTVRAVLRGHRPVIRSDGKAIRDYFYIEEGAAAYQLFAERLAEDPGLHGRAFNFSNERSLTVLELVSTVLRLMDSDLEPDVRCEASNEIEAQSLDASRAREELGWAPMYDFEDSLRRTIDWYRGLFASRKDAL